MKWNRAKFDWCVYFSDGEMMDLVIRKLRIPLSQFHDAMCDVPGRPQQVDSIVVDGEFVTEIRLTTVTFSQMFGAVGALRKYLSDSAELLNAGEL